MTFEKVRDIIVDTINCGEEQMTETASLKEDLGMDSLDAMELSMAIEEAFGITIEEDALKNFLTVKDIVTYLDEKAA